MTNDILRTDIELATRLLREQHPEEQVIAALALRGIDPARASQLVDDLRNGKDLSTQPALPTEFGFAKRSRTRGASREAGQDQPSRPSKIESRLKPPRHAAAHDHKNSAVTWLVPALVVVLVVVVAGIVVAQRRRAAANSTEDQTSAAPMVLELQPDGLHIGGRHVTPGTVLTAVAKSLGAATRTNRVGQTDAMIYAYDHQGLMVYSQKAGGTNSIVLDCEAGGGTHGTLSPFTGTVTVDGQAIRPGTAPQTLAAIKQLELSHPGTDEGVWGGSYHDLRLVFAYQKSPRRLSRIEIGLK